MIVRMFMRVIRPVSMHMGMHNARRGQFCYRMRMRPLDMVRMIVTGPVMPRLVILHQQTLAVMPAITKNVIVFLTFGSALIFAQAVPFTMGMPLQAFSYF